MKSYAASKALIFRVVVVVVDFVILYLLFDDVTSAGLATIFRHAIQILMYWYHEKVWERHPWGIVGGVESGRRTLAKTLTFRSMTIGKDIFAILFFSIELSRGLIGIVVLTVVNTIIYVLFERMWAIKERHDHEAETFIRVKA